MSKARQTQPNTTRFTTCELAVNDTGLTQRVTSPSNINLSFCPKFKGTLTQLHTYLLP